MELTALGLWPVSSSSFALQGRSSPLISRLTGMRIVSVSKNKLIQFMKFAFIAAAAALAVSCGPSAAPAPSQPTYVAPTK